MKTYRSKVTCEAQVIDKEYYDFLIKEGYVDFEIGDYYIKGHTGSYNIFPKHNFEAIYEEVK